MTLELHVWGPAFSLPSIDPQCLAAIAYLTQAVPQDQWTLVASCDVTWSPTKELPALRDGSAWVGGFRNIVDHLSKISDSRWELDHDLDRKDRANVTAFSSFVEAHGQPLLDLSLYVSSENYNAAIRPAYSRILQWPDPWLIPPQRRTLAKARTVHLNLSSLDLDNASNEERNGIAAKPGSDLIPTSLRSTRQTMTSLLRQPQHASRFRLDALSEASFEPLQQLLGQKRFLLSDKKSSSLDCLALAYLSLALLPEVPQPWLADCMKSRYPRLCDYVRVLVHEFFGGPVNVEDAVPSVETADAEAAAESPGRGREKKENYLSWRKPETKRIASKGFALVETVFEALPFVGQLHKSTMLPESRKPRPVIGDDAETVAASPPNPVLPAIFAVGTVVTGIAGYLVYSGLWNLPGSNSESSENKRLSDMGEAGAMLAMADFSGHRSRLVPEGTRAGRVPVGLEVDVALDERGAL